MGFTELFVNGEDRTTELRAIARIIRLDELVPERYSALLLIQLAVSYLSSGLNYHKVMIEIEALECGQSTTTKPPTMFTGPALGGLWHKHYFADGVGCMIRNMINSIHCTGLPWIEERARQVTDSGEEYYLTEEDAARIAHDAVIGNWERRSAGRQLTGEWIIYAQYEGQNYYLCLANHSDGDDRIRAQIDEICAAEFPFLNDLLVLLCHKTNRCGMYGNSVCSIGGRAWVFMEWLATVNRGLSRMSRIFAARFAMPTGRRRCGRIAWG